MAAEEVTLPSIPGEETGWICTASGKRFFPLCPREEDMDIEDIAAALSRSCRFLGHCREFYSIAEHSLLVATILEWDDRRRATQLDGLLHDAAEAYLPDMPRPLKVLPEFRWYRDLETPIFEKVIRRFTGYGGSFFDHECVKWADRVALKIEAEALMPPESVRRWGSIANVTGIDFTAFASYWSVKAWGPREAERAFLERFAQLGGRK